MRREEKRGCTNSTKREKSDTILNLEANKFSPLVLRAETNRRRREQEKKIQLKTNRERKKGFPAIAKALAG